MKHSKKLPVLQRSQLCFIHPFDDEERIAGQNVALELLEDSTIPIDYLFVPIGGGSMWNYYCI